MEVTKIIGWVSTYEGLPHVTTKAFTISQEAGSWSIGFSYSIRARSYAWRRGTLLVLIWELNSWLPIRAARSWPIPKL